MCLSCGCMQPEDDHGDARHVTMLVLQGAADAAGLRPMQAGANIVATLAEPGAARGESLEKAAPPYVQLGLLAKSAEQRYSLGMAFPSLKPEMRKAADGKRDVIGPEAVERAAWAYMRKSRRVGLWHADGTEGHGDVVESYVWRGPEWTVAAPNGTTQVVKAGDWMLGVVWDVPAWEAIQRGLIDGFSPQGTGQRRPAPPGMEGASR